MKSKVFRTRDKVFIITALMILLRVFASVPVPFSSGMAASAEGFGFFDLLSGRALSRLSVMALSISPYITASIVLQLLAAVFPKLHELQAGMKADREKYEKITIAAGALLALVSALAMAYGFAKQGYLTSSSAGAILLVAICWMAGSVVSVLIGKKITDKFGINGISLILLINIVSSYVPDGLTVYTNLASGKKIPMQAIIIICCALSVFALFCFVVLVQETEHRVSVQYSAKMGGASRFQQGANRIPIKLCPGSVVPVIFASSLLSLPGLIASFAGKNWKALNFLSSSHWFVRGQMIYSVGFILYALLVIFFSFFYGAMVFSPAEIASQVQKNGGTIPGIRPGKSTADYLAGQARRVHLVGALALLLIAFLPMLAGGLLRVSNLAFFGTSVIITVGVILEFRQQRLAEMQNRPYKTGGIFGIS